MRVLVTGATGFVGRALMRRLAAAGHEAIPVTRGPAEEPGAVRWDLGTEPAPAALPERIDAIVHAAQARNYRAFPGDAAEMFAVNATSTAALLDYAARAGASRFCLLSTGTVYEPFDRGLGEDAPLAPTSMLGASKLAAEVIARPYAALFPLAVLRLFTPYGPGQTARLIPSLIDRVRGGQAVQVSADGEGMRLAPIYVEDLCAIILASLDGGWSGVFNVAAPQATTIRGIADIIGRLVGRAPVFEVGAGAVLDLAPPVAKLAGRFDLGTLLPLEEGLARTVASEHQQQAIGHMAQELNPCSPGIASTVAGQNSFIARLSPLANEVNATLNSVAAQQSAESSMADAIARIEARLAADDQWKSTIGPLANEVNASYNVLLSFFAGQNALTALVSGLQLGPLANEVNATLNSVAAQQSAQGSMVDAITRIEAQLAASDERMAALNALVGSGTATVSVPQLGPLANEVNATLNNVAAQQSVQGSMTEAIARIEARLAADNERTTGHNLLLGRGIARLLSRPVADRLVVQPPHEVPAIEVQIRQIEARAPRNFAQWHKVYLRFISEVERSVVGNLSHDGQVGAGYFRMFINIHARGRLLDFGCGQLALPDYLADWPHDQLAGFDPLPPFEPHPFVFATSLGETIPWADASFETVVIATSLDHVYLLDQALEEMKRVLVPDGRLLIWTAMFPETPPYDPYGPEIVPADQNHLFHPGRNWFYDLFASDFDLLERMETVTQSEMLAFRRKLQ